MKKSLIITIIILAVVVIIGFAYFGHKTPEADEGVLVPPTEKQDEKVSVDNYLRANISALSPVQPVLGGKWYVVSETIDAATNSGTVVYEDGHIQETRNFTYAVNEENNVTSLTLTTTAEPAPQNNSGLTGKVTLSPTCPVERIPPDPSCASKPYETSISIMKSGSTQIIKTIQSDAKGEFNATLSPGSYALQAKGGNMLPRCPEVTVLVKSGEYARADISCDTGIR